MYLSVLSIFIYHTSHSCDYEKALQLHSGYKKPNFVLQVTPESISGTTSHLRCIWLCNEIKSLYN